MGNAHLGFKNFHYCLRTAGAVPVPMPGAVRLTRDPELTEIRVVPDVIGAPSEYAVCSRDGIIRLGLEIVSLPVQFLVDVLGYTIDSNGVLAEGGHPAVHFALLYETRTTEQGPVRHCYMDCICKKPKFDAATLSGSSGFCTRKLEIAANKDIFGSGKYKKSVTEEQSASVFAGWFNALY